MPACRGKKKVLGNCARFQAELLFLWEWLMTGLCCAALWNHCSLQAWCSSSLTRGGRETEIWNIERTASSFNEWDRKRAREMLGQPREVETHCWSNTPGSLLLVHEALHKAPTAPAGSLINSRGSERWIAPSAVALFVWLQSLPPLILWCLPAFIPDLISPLGPPTRRLMTGSICTARLHVSVPVSPSPFPLFLFISPPCADSATPSQHPDSPPVCHPDDMANESRRRRTWIFMYKKNTHNQCVWWSLSVGWLKCRNWEKYWEFYNFKIIPH